MIISRLTELIFVTLWLSTIYVMKTYYSTNLTDNQWQVIEKIINPQERARKHSLRDIMDTLHSLVRKLVGRDESPSMGIIDSRSVKTSTRTCRVLLYKLKV